MNSDLITPLITLAASIQSAVQQCLIEAHPSRSKHFASELVDWSAVCCPRAIVGVDQDGEMQIAVQIMRANHSARHMREWLEYRLNQQFPEHSGDFVVELGWER